MILSLLLWKPCTILDRPNLHFLLRAEISSLIIFCWTKMVTWSFQILACANHLTVQVCWI